MQCLCRDKDSDGADVEGFQRLIVTARSVAVARPANLVKFADKETDKMEGKCGTEASRTVRIHRNF